MKKTVLLTNFQMINYSGSELDTLTIANYFLKTGWDVSIFTFECGYPLITDINENIKIIDINNLCDLKSHYDLIWAHHFPLLDYLLFSKEISADYIHYLSLSAIMGLESLPEYYEELNLVSAMSDHTLLTLKSEGFNVEKISLFTNYSFETNFKHKVKKRKLKNICVVSNHVPSEVLEFAEIYQKKNGKMVDIYGVGHKYLKITPELLYKYDLVITIGRTVNETISLGIPVYCYDRFGGDGYITMENIEDAYAYAFSGKNSLKKRTSEEIYDDIILGYNNCLQDLSKVKEFGYNHFCFEKTMEKILLKIFNTKKFNLSNLLKKYPHLKRKGPLFFEQLSKKIGFINKNFKLHYCQFYFDFGDGFSEKDSVIKSYKVWSGKYCVNADIPLGVKKVRFDPSFCELTKIKKITVNGKKQKLSKLSNCIKFNNAYLSVNGDPNIVLNDVKKLKIEVEMSLINSSELFDFFGKYLKK